jgi:rhamnosyltransferase
VSPPKASVVLLTFNAGPGFEDLLQRLRAQKTDFEYEVLVIDSGSTDGTTKLAERYGASVHRIPTAEFDHGATRNLGVSLSKGEYVALLVQDAVPLDGLWLAAMVEDLERNPLVAGVYGRQVPRPESDALTRVLVNGWPTASPERREQFAGGPERYRALLPTERRTLATFDDVSSCVRRAIWEEMPFEPTRFGEDLRWGKRVVEAGYRLVYEPRAAVCHSHERGALYDLRRYYVDAQLLLELFGISATPNLARLLFNTLRSSAYLYRRLRREPDAGSAPHLALTALRHALFGQIGSYLGVKSHRTSRMNPRVAARLDRLFGKGI